MGFHLPEVREQSVTATGSRVVAAGGGGAVMGTDSQFGRLKQILETVGCTQCEYTPHYY